MLIRIVVVFAILGGLLYIAGLFEPSLFLLSSITWGLSTTVFLLDREHPVNNDIYDETTLCDLWFICENHEKLVTSNVTHTQSMST